MAPHCPRGPHRLLPATLVALAVLLTVPAVQAAHPDEDPFLHLNVDVQDLEPGQNLTRPIESPEGPLREGWVYIIYGGVQGNSTVVAELKAEGETTATFVWQPGEFHKNSTKIQKTGEHHLVLTNVGNETARYAFYYDQSCNCAGKLIPLAGGFVLFNYEFPADEDVHLRFPVIDGWTLKGAVAWHDPASPTADWPHDFDIIKQTTQPGKGWLDLSFHTRERGTYYAFIEALEGGNPQDPVSLTPEIEVQGADTTEQAPPGPLLGTLLVLVGLVALGLRGRNRIG